MFNFKFMNFKIFRRKKHKRKNLKNPSPLSVGSKAFIIKTCLELHWSEQEIEII